VRPRQANSAAALTTGQLAAFLGVHRKTVAGWIDRRQLPGYCLPGDRDRRITVKDALCFARDNNIHSQALEDYAERQGLVPLCPGVLLVSPDPQYVMPLVSARMEVTVAADVLQCGMTLASTVFDVVLLDAALGMPHVREVSNWLTERTPRTLVGLLASEDDHGASLPGVALRWKKPVNMSKVVRQLWKVLKGERRHRTQLNTDSAD
jgi:excisionase family DNA binding protein